MSTRYSAMGLLDEEIYNQGPEDFRNLIEQLVAQLTAGVSFGVPINMEDDGTIGGQLVSNVRGSWVEVQLTDFTGTVSCAHNLDIPTTTVTGAGDTANRMNVRWFIVGMEFGDRTGTNVAPAAPGGFSINLMHMSDGAVTRDSIDLLYAVNGFGPSATTPLFLSLFFIPAVI